MSGEFELRPDCCPACGGKMNKGQMIVCFPCFSSVPGNLRSTAVHIAVKTRENPAALRGIGEKIIRTIKARTAIS